MPRRRKRSVVTRAYTDYWEGRRRSRQARTSSAARVEHRGRAYGGGANSARPQATSNFARNYQSQCQTRAAADYRVVYFATTVSSPAISRALPNVARRSAFRHSPSDLDDGLLTASEVAQLELNADWVVLSAAIRSPATSPARRHCQDWPGPSFMQAPARCWCRTGRLRSSDATGSPPQASSSSRMISGSVAPRRCAAPCLLISTTPPILAMLTRPTGRRSSSWEKGLRG